jgi:hypothetical protein
VAVVAVMVASLACASGKGAEAEGDGLRADGTARAMGESTPADEVARQLRDENAEALLECARLTFASQEQVLEARLAMDARGAPVGLEVRGGDGEPGSLMCPADVVASPRVLGPGGGRSWGTRADAGWLAVAWCGPGLDGTGGACSSRVDEVVKRSAASAAPSGRPARDDATAAPSRARVGRATEPLVYNLRRLGADAGSQPPPNFSSLLQMLDQSLALCLHARQPGFSLSQSVDLVLDIKLPGPDQDLMGASVDVVGGKPADLVEFLDPCLRRVLSSAQGKGSVPVQARFTVVAERARDAPGSGVQRVEVSVVQERVETSVPTVERTKAANAMAALLAQCITHQPVEVLTQPGRWMSPGTVTLAGSVDAVRRDTVHVVEMDVSAPELLLAQGQCAVQGTKKEEAATLARAEWVFQVRVSTDWSASGDSP